jgi:long-chain acyl-CoA synthetase
VGIDGLDLPGTAPARLPTLRAGDPAMLMYTSGTTGTPKGALLSHANMLFAGRAVAGSLELGSADRVLSSLPLYHINGQCIATVAPLVAGGSIVMPHRFSVTQWWRLVDAHRPTWLNMVPTIIAYLLNGPERLHQRRRARTRFGRSASAPLPPERHRAFEKRFGISVVEAMGLTECASVAFRNPLDAARAGTDRPACRSASRRASSTLRSRAGGRPAQRSRSARGGNVMLGYFKSPMRRRRRCATADGSPPAISATATRTAITSSPAG